MRSKEQIPRHFGESFNFSNRGIFPPSLPSLLPLPRLPTSFRFWAWNIHSRGSHLANTMWWAWGLRVYTSWWPKDRGHLGVLVNMWSHSPNPGQAASGSFVMWEEINSCSINAVSRLCQRPTSSDIICRICPGLPNLIWTQNFLCLVESIHNIPQNFCPAQCTVGTTGQLY